MQGATQRQRAEENRTAILEQWKIGETIAAISRSTGVSRGAVRMLLENEGVRSARKNSRSAIRETRREELRSWVRQHPGSTAVEASDGTGIPLRTVTDYIRGTPEELLLVESRVKASEYTRDGMLAHLRDIWEQLPADERRNGISKKKYERMAAAAGGGRPSAALFEKRFLTWSAACRAAGLPPSPARRRNYSKTYSDDAVVAAVAEYIGSTGRTSFSGYSSWAQEQQGAPSGALVINRFGRWSNVRHHVINRNLGR